MTPEEKNIIHRVISGDINAFEELVLANQKNVYNLALKMTKNAEDALDISQEAFIKAFRRIAAFRGDCRFSVWMYRLTHNLCIDFLRKKAVSKQTALYFEEECGETELSRIPDLRELPEDSIIRREKWETIAKAIDSLTLKHREIITMRSVLDMSYEEISSALGVTIGTVKSRIARARKSLMEILKERGTFP
ncbi:MAG: sigma-70 family RNA polymerase sigma factor [Oscillospiraceae bacterium]|nr:sigma-70 family RNA polymerase sigma factor [Oscillospiraceae bacterium]